MLDTVRTRSLAYLARYSPGCAPPSRVIMFRRLKPVATSCSVVGWGKQVAGELLDRELVEGLVAVERVDDVIAVRENRAGSGRRGSRPCRRTAPGRARERPSARRNGATRAAGRPGARRRGGRCRARRRGPPRASGAGRSGRARAGGSGSAGRPRAMERSSSIRGLLRMNASMGLRTHDAFLTGGTGVAVRRHVGPVGLVLRPLGDPLLEQILLGRRERLVAARRGHHLLGVVAQHALDQLALVRLAGNDRLGGSPPRPGRRAAASPCACSCRARGRSSSSPRGWAGCRG